MEYGYIRVSSETQNTARQVEKMTALGIPSENLFIDHASGKDMERPAYKALIEVVTAGDRIIVDSLDRLGRNYDQVTAEWRRLTRECGVDIKALDLDFMDSSAFRAMGSLGKVMEDNILSILAYVAQTEREKIKQRQREGIAIAKENGIYKGKQKKGVTEHQVEMYRAMVAESASKDEIAEAIGVSRTTLYQMVRDGRLTA